MSTLNQYVVWLSIAATNLFTASNQMTSEFQIEKDVDLRNSTQQIQQNPLVSKWTGPYGGVPPFDRVSVGDFKPALEAAMTENLDEVEKIASDNNSPTFENTIAALERAGKTFDR